MTFGAALALLISALIVMPISAHLLRRGRTRRLEFPPVRYVALTLPKARRRSSLQDRPLLALRVTGIVGLALLGATPFVRCSSLTLSRPEGASIALALVIDDSLSMRARVGGATSRFELALDGARELLAQSRPGDTITVILAGNPARIALAPTADYAGARQLVEALGAADRSTDLSTAIELARSALQPQPQRTKRLVVLSDLAVDALPVGEPSITAPLHALRKRFSDCAVLSATAEAASVIVDVACTSPEAAAERGVELLGTGEAVTDAKTGAPAVGINLGSAPLVRTQGPQRLEIAVPATRQAGLRATLTGNDDILEDDAAPVAPREQTRSVGVVAELEAARGATGGPSILEQALLALSTENRAKPIAEVPGDARDLARFSAILIEDPPGFAPEAREALRQWMERGGVALLLLGPSAARPALGWGFEPVLGGPVHWDATGGVSLDLDSLGWLGREASTLANLAARGRAQLGTIPGGELQTKARWRDGEAWIVERVLGKGLGIVVGLPASPGLSDFALRPGFLALLDHVLHQANQRTFSGHGAVGQAWQFSKGSVHRIAGPEGAVPLRATGSSESAEPTRAGRYELTTSAGVEVRYTRIEAVELSRQPLELRGAANDASRRSTAEYSDVSRHVAFALLLVFVAEVLLRLHAKWRGARVLSRPSPADEPTPPNTSMNERVG